MKILTVAFVTCVLIAATSILASAAESQCVKSDENQKLFTSAAEGDPAALALLEKKSTGGDFCAKFSLGAAYATGKNNTGGQKLMDEALAEYQAAAEKGDPEAQGFMGSHYFFQGTEKEKAKGIELLRKAADQGNAEAMFNLGHLYDGLGRFYDAVDWKDDDPLTAAEWYRKSAEKGYQPSYAFLADMYAKGDGLPQNWHNAYFWGCLAAECFANKTIQKELHFCMDCAPSRADSDPLLATEHLSKSEIETIKKQASEWKPGTPPPIDEPGFFQKIWCRLHTPC